MKIHTESLTTDRLQAKPGSTVDLSQATTFIVPRIATASLPDPSTVEGMLVYDSTDSTLKIASGGAWVALATMA